MQVTGKGLFAGALVLAAVPFLSGRLQLSSPPPPGYGWIADDEKAVVVVNSVTPGGMGPEVHMGAGFLVAVEKRHAYILTAGHVAPGDGSKIIVTLSNRSQVFGTVVGLAPATQADVSVVSIPAGAATRLPVLKLGNSDELRPGEHLTIIGHPLFNYYTVTHGIVSAIHRTDPGLGLAAQDNVLTDAPINGGNSGGPVLDDRTREVVAISDFLPQMPNAYPNPGYGGKFDGLGALVSSRIASKVYRDVRLYGRVISGTSHIQVIDDVTRVLMDHPAIPKVSDGARIISVQQGSAAAEVGVKPDDVIVAMDGVKIHDANKFNVLEFLSHPADIEHVTVRREGTLISFAFPQGGDMMPGRRMMLSASQRPGTASSIAHHTVGHRFPLTP